jgi:integrase
MAKLSARTVETLEPPAKGRKELRDDDVTGLILRITVSGKKTWAVWYRHQGRARRVTLGVYPALGLSDARKLANVTLREIALGSDPAATKREKREAETFRELADEYIERHAKRHKKSWKEDRRALDRDLIPAIGSLKAASIKRRDILKVLEAIQERGAPILANRTLEIVKKLFNWAVEQEILEFSPAAVIRPIAKKHSRERVLTDDEISAVWHALAYEPPKVRAIFQLLFLTAQRKGEVARMAISQLDLSSKVWTIPAAHSKNGRTHRVPLTNHSLEIIQNHLPKVEGDTWLFPAVRSDAPITRLEKAMTRIKKRSKVDFCPHDIRRTVASKMTGDLRVSRFVLERILNHTDNSVTAVYDRHSYDQEKRDALCAWADRLLGTVRKPNTDHIK